MAVDAFKAWFENPTNRDLFEIWYNQANPVLFVQVYKLTGGNKSLSEDLLHDVMIQFLDRKEVTRMRNESAARAFIVTSVRNRWRDYLRRENKNESLDTLDEPSSPDSPVELMLLEERLASIEKVLTEDERGTFWRMIEGKDLKEISQEESIKYSNAGVKVHRIRNKIRDLKN